MRNNIPDLLAGCRVELKRTGYSSQSKRVLDFCERMCGKRGIIFLNEKHLEQLLKRLKSLPTQGESTQSDNDIPSLNIQKYKGEVVLLPTGDTFTVVDGTQKNGTWFLQDTESQLYPMEDCELVGCDEYYEKLKNCRSLSELNSFHAAVGQEAFDRTWRRLAVEPVQEAAVAILYCSNWKDFCKLTEQYLVNSQYPEQNKHFRELLKQKELDQVVGHWYNTRENHTI